MKRKRKFKFGVPDPLYEERRRLEDIKKDIIKKWEEELSSDGLIWDDKDDI